MRRRPTKSDRGSIFPFLAVLVSTMGAMILLLLIITRQAQRSREAEAQRAVAPLKEPPPLPPLPEIERYEPLPAPSQLPPLAELELPPLPALRDPREKLLGERDRLLDQWAALAAREKSASSEPIDPERVKRLLEQLRQQRSLLASAREATSRKLTQLERERGSLEKKKRQLEWDEKHIENRYAIVPYTGPNGTPRRPIYLECRSETITLQPEGVVITPADLAHPERWDNSLAEVVRAIVDSWPESQGNDSREKVTPYPLFLVRPDGIAAYYLARKAIEHVEAPYGYELVASDVDLAFPNADPKIERLANEVLERQRRMAPRYRPSPYSGPLARGSHGRQPPFSGMRRPGEGRGLGSLNGDEGEEDSSLDEVTRELHAGPARRLRSRSMNRPGSRWTSPQGPTGLPYPGEDLASTSRNGRGNGSSTFDNRRSGGSTSLGGPHGSTSLGGPHGSTSMGGRNRSAFGGSGPEGDRLLGGGSRDDQALGEGSSGTPPSFPPMSVAGGANSGAQGGNGPGGFGTGSNGTNPYGTRSNGTSPYGTGGNGSGDLSPMTASGGTGTGGSPLGGTPTGDEPGSSNGMAGETGTGPGGGSSELTGAGGQASDGPLIGSLTGSTAGSRDGSFGGTGASASGLGDGENSPSGENTGQGSGSSDIAARDGEGTQPGTGQGGHGTFADILMPRENGPGTRFASASAADGNQASSSPGVGVPGSQSSPFGSGGSSGPASQGSPGGSPGSSTFSAGAPSASAGSPGQGSGTYGQPAAGPPPSTGGLEGQAAPPGGSPPAGSFGEILFQPRSGERREVADDEDRFSWGEETPFAEPGMQGFRVDRKPITRDIIIECRRVGLVMHPEKEFVSLRNEDETEAGLGAVYRHVRQQRLSWGPPPGPLHRWEPVIVFKVRPGGLENYYRLRTTMLKDERFQSRRELINAESVLNFDRFMAEE
ncbi:hypothetical protein Pan216_45040 [Planctomycetes bacterium Pan216]|uniref:Uncharacterized protein n=1 Tax=Kolteria novifilia TaxID=2527975 RepID=A0A518B9N4_9BACT|nr:hypothetical protein Pan216_45040 [Planctomycetes bacterium Pan216]